MDSEKRIQKINYGERNNTNRLELKRHTITYYVMNELYFISIFIRVAKNKLRI